MIQLKILVNRCFDMQKNLKISVFGKNYSICSDESESEVLGAAEMLDNLMKSKSGTVPHDVENEKIAVVAALQLALDLNKKNKTLELCERKMTNLVALIEDAS